MFVIIIHYAVSALVKEWREWLCLFKTNKMKSRRGKLLNHITCHVSQKLKQPFWPLPPDLYTLSISFSTYYDHVYNVLFHFAYILYKIQLYCNYEARKKFYRHAASATSCWWCLRITFIVMSMYGPRVKRYPLLVLALLENKHAMYKFFSYFDR